MKVLITGCAGFIGFSIAKELIEKNYKVYGIDNFDNYYSLKLKKKELENCKKIKNLSLKKLILHKKKIKFLSFKNFI